MSWTTHSLGGGHYDTNGHWVQTKHCFVSCGASCDCQPPGGIYYSAARDQREPKGDPQAQLLLGEPEPPVSGA